MENKFKELQQKLNSLSQPIEDYQEHSQKVKIKALQQSLQKVHARCDEENILWEHKINSMFDQLRKIQHSLKEANNELDIEQNTMNTRAGKLQKTVRKIMQKLSKERKEADKKIQSCLETYLIQLTSFKGKAANGCLASIRELKELEKDVDTLQKEVKRESQLSKDIHKKIYSQFSTQIEEIGSGLLLEERVRQQEEQKLLDSIERTYNVLNRAILDGRKQREKQEKDVVDFLQKVIQKIKYEILND